MIGNEVVDSHIACQGAHRSFARSELVVIKMYIIHFASFEAKSLVVSINSGPFALVPGKGHTTVFQLDSIAKVPADLPETSLIFEVLLISHAE